MKTDERFGYETCTLRTKQEQLRNWPISCPKRCKAAITALQGIRLKMFGLLKKSSYSRQTIRTMGFQAAKKKPAFSVQEALLGDYRVGGKYFLNAVTRTFETCLKYEILIVDEDCNSLIEKEDSGNTLVHIPCTKLPILTKGEIFKQQCDTKPLLKTPAFCSKRSINKRSINSSIYYVIVEHRHLLALMNARTCRGSNIDPNQCLVGMVFQGRITTSP